MHTHGYTYGKILHQDFKAFKCHKTDSQLISNWIVCSCTQLSRSVAAAVFFIVDPHCVCLVGQQQDINPAVLNQLWWCLPLDLEIFWSICTTDILLYYLSHLVLPLSVCTPRLHLTSCCIVLDRFGGTFAQSATWVLMSEVNLVLKPCFCVAMIRARVVCFKPAFSSSTGFFNQPLPLLMLHPMMGLGCSSLFLLMFLLLSSCLGIFGAAHFERQSFGCICKCSLSHSGLWL